jgi:hypothetical protein
MIRENIKISAKESLGCEFKKHNPCFDQECSKLVDQRKQAQFQRLQDSSETNWGNLEILRCEASTYFRNKRREYLKDKLNELATNSKSKSIRDLYRGINEFKRGYQLINKQKTKVN